MKSWELSPLERRIIGEQDKMWFKKEKKPKKKEKIKEGVVKFPQEWDGIRIEPGARIKVERGNGIVFSEWGVTDNPRWERDFSFDWGRRSGTWGIEDTKRRLQEEIEKHHKEQDMDKSQTVINLLGRRFPDERISIEERLGGDYFLVTVGNRQAKISRTMVAAMSYEKLTGEIIYQLGLRGENMPFPKDTRGGITKTLSPTDDWAEQWAAKNKKDFDNGNSGAMGV